MPPAEPRLQRQLVQWVLVPLLFLLVLDSVVSYWTSIHFSNLAYDRSLHEIAREVALHVKGNGDLPKLEMSPASERILLVDQDDRVFYKVSSKTGAVIGGDAEIPPSTASQPLPHGRPHFHDAVLHDLPVRVVDAWLPLGEGASGGPVRVQVAETVNKRNRLTWEILASVLVPQLLLVALASGAVYVGVLRGLVPLKRLKAAVAGSSHRDLSPVELAGVPAEVRPLVEEVNELMFRLDKTLDLQSRFIADAAHQLKTPVAGLKAQIELALRERDPESLRHSIAQMYVSADRMSRLVRQLLLLARNEPGAAEAVQLQSLDLTSFTLGISMDWVPQALRSDIDLGFEGPEHPLPVNADGDRLRELVNNLIDNAVRYSRQGGRVTVAVSEAPNGQARLSVSDDGPSIPVEERGRVFERFHRLLGSHTDGSGLGLAIVSEIAALHGAHITLEEDVDGIGNTFSVTFPSVSGMRGPAT